jgi:hypothetical protein
MVIKKISSDYIDNILKYKLLFYHNRVVDKLKSLFFNIHV